MIFNSNFPVTKLTIKLVLNLKKYKQKKEKNLLIDITTANFLLASST